MDIGTRHISKSNIIFLCVVLAVGAFIIHMNRSAHVTPHNEAARQNRIVNFKYKPGSSKGEISARLASGERLRGDYKLVMHNEQKDASEAIYRLRESGRSMADTYLRLHEKTLGAREDEKDLYRGELIGDEGTKMKCEYYFAPLGNDGIGACRSNEGALFRVVF